MNGGWGEKKWPTIQRAHGGITVGQPRHEAFREREDLLPTREGIGGFKGVPWWQQLRVASWCLKKANYNKLQL